MNETKEISWNGILILTNWIAWLYVGVRDLVPKWISYTAFGANFVWLLNRQVTSSNYRKKKGSQRDNTKR